MQEFCASVNNKPAARFHWIKWAIWVPWIGIIAMKVFPSARKAELKDFKSGRYPFHQAALRWVLRDPYVDSAIISLNVLDQIDEYMTASGADKK